MSTKEVVLDAAYKLAEKKSVEQITSEEIVCGTQFSKPTLFYHFKNLAELRKAVIDKAIDDENVFVLRHLLPAGHPALKNISNKLRQKIIKSLF